MPQSFAAALRTIDRQRKRIGRLDGSFTETTLTELRSLEERHLALLDQVASAPVLDRATAAEHQVVAIQSLDPHDEALASVRAILLSVHRFLRDS